VQADAHDGCSHAHGVVLQARCFFSSLPRYELTNDRWVRCARSLEVAFQADSHRLQQQQQHQQNYFYLQQSTWVTGSGLQHRH
jgi:hypothetical protein